MSKFNNIVGRAHMIFLSRPLAINLFFAIILIAGISITPLLIGAKANAQALTNTQSFSFPVDITYPAAESLCSEDIVLSGTLHVVTIFTINSNGGSVVKEQFNPQGITGIGLDPKTHQSTGINTKVPV